MRQKSCNLWGYSLTQRAFIYLFVWFCCKPKFLNTDFVHLLRVGVGRRRGRLTVAIALALFLLSFSLLVADSKKRFCRINGRPRTKNCGETFGSQQETGPHM